MHGKLAGNLFSSCLWALYFAVCERFISLFVSALFWCLWEHRWLWALYFAVCERIISLFVSALFRCLWAHYFAVCERIISLFVSAACRVEGCGSFLNVHSESRWEPSPLHNNRPLLMGNRPRGILHTLLEALFSPYMSSPPQKKHLYQKTWRLYKPKISFFKIHTSMVLRLRNRYLSSLYESPVNPLQGLLFFCKPIKKDLASSVSLQTLSEPLIVQTPLILGSADPPPPLPMPAFALTPAHTCKITYISTYKHFDTDSDST